MSRKLIWIVTVLMGLAMAALIVLQAYWIKNAIRVNERQFDQLVKRSMIDIVQEIEWNEAERLIQRQIDHELADSRSFGRIDTKQNRKPGLDELLSNRQKLVDRVIASMLDVPPKIEGRIGQEELVETITRVLDENGLEDHQFEYAVLRWNKEIAYRSESFNIAEAKELYRIQLFPDDLLPASNELTLYFPGKRNSLFETIGHCLKNNLVAL